MKENLLLQLKLSKKYAYKRSLTLVKISGGKTRKNLKLLLLFLESRMQPVRMFTITF